MEYLPFVVGHLVFLLLFKQPEFSMRVLDGEGVTQQQEECHVSKADLLAESLRLAEHLSRGLHYFVLVHLLSYYIIIHIHVEHIIGLVNFHHSHSRLAHHQVLRIRSLEHILQTSSQVVRQV